MARIYDTRTRRTEEIVPARALRMYTCGPTVHRPAHIGDLRSHLLSDLIRRVLERRRVRLVVCRNITDVGLLAGDAEAGADGAPAWAEGRPVTEVARHHEESFQRDTAALNLRSPEHAPRAGETIEPMVELIAKLIEQGHAYAVSDGSVFFDAASFPTYGEISGNRLDALKPGHRHGDVDPRKRFHADWALWRPGDGEPTWDTPWGRGLPSRHIECSAMSLRFLGERVDIHTGGIDLRFPHHENERAQSDSAAGHEVVKHWVHGEQLLFDGRPMAGSTGNVVLLSDVVEAGLDPLAVRLAFMEQRYRHQVSLDWDALRAADRTLRRWRGRVAEWAESPSAPMARDHVERAEAAFDDDLDTPAALRILRELEHDESVPPGSKFESFLHLDHVLALDLSTEIGRAPVLPPGAAELLDQRARARDSHDWPVADRLRDSLAEVGVLVSDTPDGQVWVLGGH
ncbi:CysS/YqeB C-terminal domain-containing protein [Nonomuraea cavernae]|uniref:Cysteine--tRNA ligase n=1 Tax=Nonomuraea cavernae TaxID=2045107 RepID=A0A917YX11_9ACTN|nr:cysteine--tRNA ligase [Nonomuraea cavernae]MCA2186724.1 cysteine--tRNA ligase [Nonomuraea cavernae]GGO67775.1 cysteine--tRNA ligase [Nonomuraea cavernae]